MQGRILFPAAAMLEMALATASKLCQLEAPAAEQLAVSRASIAAPLVLQAGKNAALCCTAHLGRGLLDLTSGSGPTQRQHMAAQPGTVVCVQGIPKASKPTLQQRMFAAFVALAADILAEAVPQLLTAAAAAGGIAALPVATGQVDARQLLRQLQQPDGYLVHPAMLDAATHTAAALQSSQRADAGVTRIPVGVDALLAPACADEGTPRAAQHWCQGVFSGMSADGAALTSFTMAPAGSGSPGLQFSGFRAKVIAGSKMADPARTAPAMSAPAPAETRIRPVAATVDPVAVQRTVQATVNKMLGATVAPDQPLMEAGLDSLGEKAGRWFWMDEARRAGIAIISTQMLAHVSTLLAAGAVELRSALNTAFDFELPATATFDFPTVAALSRFIAEQQQGQLDSQPAPASEQPGGKEVEQGQLGDIYDWESGGEPSGQQNLQVVDAPVPAAAHAAVGPTRASVAAKISGVVRRMLGVEVEAEQPLMEAGLDSLGEYEHQQQRHAIICFNLHRQF